MAAPKSSSRASSGADQRDRRAGKASTATAMLVGPDQTLSAGADGFKLTVPKNASRMLISRSKQVGVLLQSYGEAIARSRTAGRRVSFRVEVDARGATVVSAVEDAVAARDPAVVAAAPDAELEAALAAARQRGRLRAAEILSHDDMLSADAFAKTLGTSRVTVNSKRQNGQVLGLDGAKRGYRFPVWQLDTEGRPYTELVTLHELLGGPWAVYRFLVQPHGQLDGLSGREALERGRAKAALEAAESIGRDLR
ncbi:XRE family transcriptional regulator [Lichenicoccus roseus]|uniref:XRE family transcriptional regulator n=1 Tax=Lichenicoccus roseus TaxID=2683649 RepID=A0A5R9J2I9_9PROT|nr:XRE family transcriptional regulator [Lichenicoccus roseus]TLU70697.1 XRE family transcriptional regulator [Lichenicoccus roseus]